MDTIVQKIGLLQLQQLVKASLEDVFFDRIWVAVEVAECKVNRNGHCYLTLIENDERGMVAKAQAIVWAGRWRVLGPFFEHSVGKPLEAGMRVLVEVQVQYSELYGLSLIVDDIDPSCTIGAAEQERPKTIARLTAEGMMELNSLLILGTLPRRFAVVSGESAAGYGDFMNHLHKNPYGYSFATELFAAPMQGKEAPGGIIAALDAIAGRAEEFDAVLILRGGGSMTDLACFDDYDLALNIAQFPLPVLTAIGHERDFHIADMVAHTYLKTPTALADFFVDLFAQDEYAITSLESRMLLAIKGKKAVEVERMERIRQRMLSNVAARAAAERSRLEMLEMRISRLNPASILEQGFAMPLQCGRRVAKAAALDESLPLVLILIDGTAECEIKKIQLNGRE
mgnify:CR=1 FL=1